MIIFYFLCHRDYQVYLVEDAEKELGLSREDFISLAYFLGSDYTEGINGVGIVNAMEILQAFPFEKSEEGILQGLEKFKEWLQGYDYVAEIMKKVNEKTYQKKSSGKKKRIAKNDPKNNSNANREDHEEEDEEREEKEGIEESEDLEIEMNDKSQAMVTPFPFLFRKICFTLYC